ncbi:MAG: sodium:proton antiporter [Chloroflexi bacterium]|nr:sodium:proton antiporter [Chloroflexota bacterium]
MIRPFESSILRYLLRALVPAILLFGLYVIAHGEVSPGGGFQGGAIMGAGIVLARLTLERRRWAVVLSTKSALVIALIGGLITFGVGVVPLLAGANFLDYSALPLPADDGKVLPHFTLRSVGIFLFELGVAMMVMSVMVVIFDHLADYTDDR